MVSGHRGRVGAPGMSASAAAAYPLMPMWDKGTQTDYLIHGGPVNVATNSPGASGRINGPGRSSPRPPAPGYGPWAWADKLNGHSTGWNSRRVPRPSPWRDQGKWDDFVAHGGPTHPIPPPPPAGYGPWAWADHLNGKGHGPDSGRKDDHHMGIAVRAAYGAKKLRTAAQQASRRAHQHMDVALKAANRATSALRQVQRRMADGSVQWVNMPMQALPEYGTVEFDQSSYPTSPMYDPTQDPQSAYYDISQSNYTLGYGAPDVDVYDSDPNTQSWAPPDAGQQMLQPMPCPPGWTDLGDGVNCADPTGQFGMPYAQAWAYYDQGGGGDQIGASVQYTPNPLDGMTADSYDDGSGDDDGSVDVDLEGIDDDGNCPDGYFSDGSGNCVNNADAGAVDSSAAMDGN